MAYDSVLLLIVAALLPSKYSSALQILHLDYKIRLFGSYELLKMYELRYTDCLVHLIVVYHSFDLSLLLQAQRQVTVTGTFRADLLSTRMRISGIPCRLPNHLT